MTRQVSVRTTSYMEWILIHLKPQDTLKVARNVVDIDQHREKIRSEACKTNKRSQGRQKAEYDQRHTPRQYQIGQLVLIRDHAGRPELSRKFYPSWHGLHVILQTIGGNDNPRAIQVFDIDELKPKVYAVENVKPYVERPGHLRGKSQQGKEGESQVHPPCGDELHIDFEATCNPITLINLDAPQ